MIFYNKTKELKKHLLIMRNEGKTMSMNVNDFKKKFTKELFTKASECKNLREMLALMEKEGFSLDEEELNMFTSMMGEKNKRPDDSKDIEWGPDCYDRFKIFTETCDNYVERSYPSDRVWEAGHDPRVEYKPKEHICMNCDKARSKQYYCFCTK